MPAEGGAARRMTWLGPDVHGARLDARRPRSCSSRRMASRSSATTARTRSTPRAGCRSSLPLGQVNHLAFGPGKAMVIGRNTADPARWKRYAAAPPGTCGSMPRAAAVPPHDGARRQRHEPDVDRRARLFPVRRRRRRQSLLDVVPDGSDLRRHTDHDDFYARHAQTDGTRIVYQCGADIWLFDPASDSTRKLDIDVPAHRTQAARKFVPAPASTWADSACTLRATASRSTRAASCSRWRCGKARCASYGGGRRRAPSPWPVAGRRRAPWSR